MAALAVQFTLVVGAVAAALCTSVVEEAAAAAALGTSVVEVAAAAVLPLPSGAGLLVLILYRSGVVLPLREDLQPALAPQLGGPSPLEQMTTPIWMGSNKRTSQTMVIWKTMTAMETWITTTKRAKCCPLRPMSITDR